MTEYYVHHPVSLYITDDIGCPVKWDGRSEGRAGSVTRSPLILLFCLMICSTVLRLGLKTCWFFCQQFFSLGLESVEDKSEHDLAGMADRADGTIVLTLPEVAFLR